MYNFSGLYYIMIIYGGICGVLGVIFILTSRFWNTKKRNVKELVFGIVGMVLFIFFVSRQAYAIYESDIGVCEGSFVDEYRESKSIFRTEYCFEEKSGEKPIFYLDTFSKKKIYPEEFIKGDLYKIHFEKKTKTIVKVEKLE